MVRCLSGLSIKWSLIKLRYSSGKIKQFKKEIGKVGLKPELDLLQNKHKGARKEVPKHVNISIWTEICCQIFKDIYIKTFYIHQVFCIEKNSWHNLCLYCLCQPYLKVDTNRPCKIISINWTKRQILVQLHSQDWMSFLASYLF